MKYLVLLTPAKLEWVVTSEHEGGGHHGVWSGPGCLEFATIFSDYKKAQETLERYYTTYCRTARVLTADEAECFLVEKEIQE